MTVIIPKGYYFENEIRVIIPKMTLGLLFRIKHPDRYSEGSLFPILHGGHNSKGSLFQIYLYAHYSEFSMRGVIPKKDLRLLFRISVATHYSETAM